MSPSASLVVAVLGIAALGAVLTLLVLRTRRDAVTLLCGFLLALFALPSFFVLAPLGAIGSPALLIGVGLAAVWATAKAVPSSGLDRGWQPIRVVVLVYAAVMVLSYANGQLRPLSALESSGSARALVFLVSLCGIGLLVADGVETRARLDFLLRFMVGAVGFVAALGIIQFFSGVDPLSYLRIPGLELNRGLVGISERSIFNRPYGTSQHYIEFGVLLGATLPLALHYAMFSPPGRRRLVQWALVLLVAAGIPMSVSRSGVVAALVAMPVLALAWRGRRLTNMAVGSVAFVGAMWALVPGLIGTLRSLFLSLDSDPSIVARRERVPAIMDYIAEHPWLGHGFGTFSVEEYLLVDNEVYVTAIATGLIGLAALIGLYLVSVAVALDVRRLTEDDETRHLAQAIAAGLLALMVCLYTFDAFHYRQFMGTTLLLVGSAGALWRLAPRDRLRLAVTNHPAALPRTARA